MISAVCQAFIDSEAVKFVDNGKAPRWLHDWGYAKKIGWVDHIPVARTLADLTGYFNGGNALGSTHFGIGRDVFQQMDHAGWRFPVAEVHQYMPIRRNGTYPNGCSPWAQGVANRPTADIVATIVPTSGLNGAFHSVENVAMAGTDGVPDAQFNSNVLLRAYCASLDEYPIEPRNNLWHSDIDSVNRPLDPGWPISLYEAMLDASRRLQQGDVSGLRSRVALAAPPVPAGPDVRPVDVGLNRLDIEAVARILAESHLRNGGDGNILRK